MLATGGNLMSLSGTAVSRYLKIIHPKMFNLVFGRKINIAILACIFLSVPALILLPAIIGVWGKLGYDPNTITCASINDNSGYDTFLMLCSIIIPIVFISFCYLRILCKVCANHRKIQAARHGEQQQQMSMREDLRYTGMMVSIFVAFLLSYTPYFIYRIIDPYVAHMTYRFITIVCLWFSSCINPVLYGLLNRNFRQAFLNIYKDVNTIIFFPRAD